MKKGNCVVGRRALLYLGVPSPFAVQINANLSARLDFDHEPARTQGLVPGCGHMGGDPTIEIPELDTFGVAHHSPTTYETFGRGEG